jgi:ABC-type amino acid transport/signal transduction systems, periplasmic component/domain
VHIVVSGVMRAIVGLAAVTALLGAAAGCGADGGGESIIGKDGLVIGVKPDQPGLGIRESNGTYVGFDVDVARYIARELGVTDPKFVSAPSSKREDMIRDGEVDMVVATYSITPQRKTKVAFGGPYYVAHQDTLVRANETAIDNVRDLRGRKLCEVTGSNSWRRVKEERKIAVDLVQSPSYSDCMTKLKSGAVDAVSTDDLILAGFASSAGRSVRIINAPISDERYGVGIKQSDIDGCEAINKAITKMYQDGTAAKLLEKWFGKTSLTLTDSVPQFEGCGEGRDSE